MKKCIAAVVMMLSVTLSGAAMAQSAFTIMTEELPPFNFEQEGVVQGISADVLMRLMDMVGNQIERSSIQIVPWARGYNKVLEEPGTVLFSMARTEQREPLFTWVGPITDLTLGLIAPKEKKILINSIEDAKGYRIGSIRDGAPEQLVIKAGIEESSLDRISQPDLNIKKLQAGRIDMFAFNVPTTFYLMIQMGLDPNDYEVVYTLKEAQLYFAFHHDMDAAFIARMNTALEELKQPDSTGKSEFDRIVETYLGKRP